MALASENIQVLRLTQAMIGSVSPNFRRVTLETKAPDAISLRFLLENDDPKDREEIGEIAFEFEALQEADIDIDVTVVADPRPIEQVTVPGRIVYGRREDEG